MRPIHHALVLAVVTASLSIPASAQAAQGSIDVSVTGKGSVSFGGAPGRPNERIDCPGDCSGSFGWPDDGSPPMPNLSAAVPAGFAVNWSGCDANSAPDRCRVDLGDEENRQVGAVFTDVTDPAVAFAIPAPAGSYGGRTPTVAASATASDNDAIARVEMLLDEEVVGVDTSAPFQFAPSVAGRPSGTYGVSLRAFDVSGRSTRTSARTITVDNSPPGLTFTGGNADGSATRGAGVGWSFVADEGNPECSFGLVDGAQAFRACTTRTTFDASPADDGRYRFSVRTGDAVGNQTIITRTVVVDRTAPGVELTGGPGDGTTVVPGDVTYAWTDSDPTAGVSTRSCGFDGVPSASCDGRTTRPLGPGSHTFWLDVTDGAGNVTSIRRQFTVAGAAPPPGDKGSPGGPLSPSQGGPGSPSPGARLAVALRAPGKVRRAALRRGLRVAVRCSAACAGTVTLTGPRGLRRSAKLTRRSAGIAHLRISFSRKALRGLRTGSRLKLVVAAGDASGSAMVRVVR